MPLPTNFSNASPARDVHPAAHNDVNAAVNALQETVNALAGATALGHVHTQSTPASLWAITHALPFQPNVTVCDSTGKVVRTDVTYVTSTLIHIETSAPFAGTARLS
jgi:hypothetical protein